MALPVNVTLDRVDLSPLDLTPMIEPGSLSWSSVVPGGFGSCSFLINGDFRRLLKLLPYLSIVRVVADSGKVLFEGQIEDLSPTLSEETMGITVGAFGLQNALKEQSIRTAWSIRDLSWNDVPLGTGSATGLGVTTAPEWQFTKVIGQVNPADLTQVGVQIAGNGSSVTTLTGAIVDLIPPAGLTLVRFMADFTYAGSIVGTAADASSTDGSSWTKTSYTASASINRALVANANRLRLGFYDGGATVTIPATNIATWLNMRLLCTSIQEDSAGGFWGGTLVNDIVARTPALGTGVIEAGTDFLVDHLDASVRRQAYDILQEVATYYSREWAVWENALLQWVTPNLSQPQWLLPISVLSTLDLDASVQNSQRAVAVLYTDAASQVTAEATAGSTDRRNPYVLKGRVKDLIHADDLTMTANTAQQLATAIMQDLGFGPVPASGTLSLPGETIVSHASASQKKAWEIRAGENVTIPELPLADVFTQDGRGECLFHVVSAEADTSEGTVTLTLDSYGSKRSDVLLARLAAVTQTLGG